MWPQALLGNAAQCLKWHISATAPSGLLEQRKSTYHEVWTRCWLRSHSNTWRYITIIWKIWVIELLTSIWRATCLFQRDIHEASVILFQGLKHSTWSVCTIPSVYPRSFCTSSDLLSPSILLLSQVLSSPGFALGILLIDFVLLHTSQILLAAAWEKKLLAAISSGSACREQT